jgi:hypothetical protein
VVRGSQSDRHRVVSAGLSSCPYLGNDLIWPRGDPATGAAPLIVEKGLTRGVDEDAAVRLAYCC